MLTWTAIFAVVWMIASSLGFTDVALAAAILAKACFTALMVLFTVLFIGGPKMVDTLLGRFSRALLT